LRTSPPRSTVRRLRTSRCRSASSFRRRRRSASLRVPKRPGAPPVRHRSSEGWRRSPQAVSVTASTRPRPSSGSLAKPTARRSDCTGWSERTPSAVTRHPPLPRAPTVPKRRARCGVHRRTLRPVAIEARGLHGIAVDHALNERQVAGIADRDGSWHARASAPPPDAPIGSSVQDLQRPVQRGRRVVDAAHRARALGEEPKLLPGAATRSSVRSASAEPRSSCRSCSPISVAPRRSGNR